MGPTSLNDSKPSLFEPNDSQVFLELSELQSATIPSHLRQHSDMPDGTTAKTLNATSSNTKPSISTHTNTPILSSNDITLRRSSNQPSVSSSTHPKVLDLSLSSLAPHPLVNEQGRRLSELTTRVHVSLDNQQPKDIPVFDEDVVIVKENSAGLVENISVPHFRAVEAFEIEEPGQPTSTEVKKQRLRAMMHFCSICLCFSLLGWNDGTTGPLLPRMQAYYHVNFTVVSLIFISNTVGYIMGAIANIYLNDHIGFGKVMALGAIIQTVTYAIQSPGGPFPLQVSAYALGGFGIALQNAQGNGFLGALRDPTKMGIAHAAYGTGALVAPLVSTRFAAQRHWSFHYLISTGLSFSNFLCILAVFRLRSQDDLLVDAGVVPVQDADINGRNRFRQIINTRVLHFLAAFATIYVGIEVTLGGWTVTYIINERHGGPSAGYISTGFFGGLALGRLVLIWVNRLIGEHRVVYIYIAIAIGLEITVWLVPSLYANAIAISIIGVLIGPIYPILMNHCARILPRWILTASVGWIASTGQTGSALLPFLTGVIASRVGIVALQPLIVGMMCAMLVIWAIIPKGHTRAD